MRALLLGLVLLLAGSPSHAQSLRDYGYARVPVPAGWTAEEAPQGLVLYPASDPSVIVLLALDQGAVSDLGAFYSQTQSALTGGETLLENAPPQGSSMGPESALAGGMTGQSADGSVVSRLLVVAAPGGRGTVLLYGSDDQTKLETHFAGFQAVLAGISFTPAQGPAQPQMQTPPPVAQPPAQPGDPTMAGLWAGTEQRMFFNAATSQMQMSWIDHYVFLAPDGRFLLGVPLNWQSPDWAAECGKREAYACGTYQIGNGALILRQNDGQTRERFWKPEGAQVNGGGYYLWRAVAAPAGLQLAGTFRASTMMPIGYLGTQTGFAVAGTEWTFTADGRFRTVSGGGSTIVGLGGSSGVSEAGGRYQVNGTTITFAFDTGGQEVASFFLWGDSGTLIDINGRKFSKAE